MFAMIYVGAITNGSIDSRKRKQEISNRCGWKCERCVAMEHMFACRYKKKPCKVPMCSFRGNAREMQLHNDTSMAHHNSLLMKAHKDLLYETKNKSGEAGEDYVKEISGMWCTTWKIEDLRKNVSLASLEGIPMASPNFRKSEQIWRILLDSGKEISLQLVSSDEPVSVKATFAVSDVSYGPFYKEVMKDGEMITCAAHLGHINTLEVQVATTTYRYHKQGPCTSKKAGTGVKTDTLEKQLSDFVDALEETRHMQEIIERAKEVSKDISKDIGKGGRSGLAAFSALDKEVREIFDARLKASETLGQLVDCLVAERLQGKICVGEVNLLDEVYGVNQGLSTKGQSFKSMGNQVLYISGAIIRLFSRKK